MNGVGLHLPTLISPLSVANRGERLTISVLAGSPIGKEDIWITAQDIYKV